MTQPTAEDLVHRLREAADQGDHRWAVELCRPAANEIKRLREDVARYENGRVVLMAELNQAKQLAMRQANELRRLAGSKSQQKRYDAMQESGE